MAVNVNMTAVVKDVDGTYLHVRDHPGMDGRIIGKLYDGHTMPVTQNEGDWYYSPQTGGWSHGRYLDLTNHEQPQVVTHTKQEQEEAAAKVKTEAELAAEVEAELQRQLGILRDSLSNAVATDAQIEDGLLINDLNGVYGIPYQFMANADTRLSVRNTSRIGRKYAERIISKMPLLYVTPGSVKFMTNYSKEAKIEGIEGVITGKVETEINNIIKDDGKFFTFKFDYAGYFEYVNGLCRSCARMLNIENIHVTIGDNKDMPLHSVDWGKALNSNLKAATAHDYVGFYIDSVDSVSESFSNETTQSQVANTMNQFSDMAREVGFLLGAGAGKTIAVMDEANLAKTEETIEKITKDYLGGASFLKNIGNGFATVSTGGKLVFPEIWSDSTFTRNFDISVKLRTPDMDTLSWYLNICVPLCHWICLAAGHQTDNRNGYHSPFLIRAFYKGLFNVDMGLVSDLSITKGKESAYNIDGLPTEVDISVTIKDLYKALSIVPGNEAKNFVTNTMLMDYIANTCGININKPDLLRTLDIYCMLTKNAFTDIPARVTRTIQDIIDTYNMDLTNSLIRKYLL